jgi:hypothetical protein
VGDDRFAHLDGQRQHVAATALSPYRDLTAAPVKVFQL